MNPSAAIDSSSTPTSNPSKLILPNVRKILIPDPGYTLFEADLSGADAQVVAWEAEDEDLKAAFRAGLDVHAKNAEDMLGVKFTRLDPSTYEWSKIRKNNKQAVHLTNYGGSARAMAMVLGWTTHDADQFQKRWFSLHPGIKKNFHGKVDAALKVNRTVTNPFGFRRIFFDRADVVFPEALAWIPQSSVALNTYLGAFALEAAIPIVEFLLQVHDSLVFQLPTHSPGWTHASILSALRVETPYPDPLFIPWTLSSSTKSWGDAQKVKI